MSSPPSSSARSRIPTQSEAARWPHVRVKPGPSSRTLTRSDVGRPRPARPRRALAPAVLDRVGQRLLHDAIDAGLELGLKPSLGAPVLECQVDVDVDIQSARSEPVDQRQQRRLQSELIQRRGPQLGDQRRAAWRCRAPAAPAPGRSPPPSRRDRRCARLPTASAAGCRAPAVSRRAARAPTGPLGLGGRQLAGAAVRRPPTEPSRRPWRR